MLKVDIKDTKDDILQCQCSILYGKLKNTKRDTKYNIPREIDYLLNLVVFEIDKL